MCPSPPVIKLEGCHPLGGVAGSAHKKISFVLLDPRKAFDSINHDQLLMKVKYYGIRGPLLQLLRHHYAVALIITFLKLIKP